MKKEEYGLLTFKTTHFALHGEKVFRDKKLVFKTIPTPREVSQSCGLALLFMVDDIDKVKEMVANQVLTIDGLYLFIKEGHKSNTERLV